MQASPTYEDVASARSVIAPHLQPTPLYNYPGLSRLLDADVWVKHENHQPIGVFKVRGGINLMSRMSDEERAAGVATASTGNHGQSIAYAARLFGVDAAIYVPANPNPAKAASIRSLGARVVEGGRDFDDAREQCEADCVASGRRYVHAGNEAALIAGVATASDEVFDALPDVDAIVVPVGGGSGAAGASIVAAKRGPEMRVVGVQAAAAPAAFESWKAQELREAAMGTFAEGLATRTAFELPQRILWEHLKEFVLVGEDDMRQAMLLMLENTRNLVEAAGAASLAGARQIKESLEGRKVVLMCTGGTVSLPQLAELMKWRP